MPKKAPKLESIKLMFVLFFIVGLALCYWMENSLGAFIVLLVGMMIGGLARDVKYAEQSKENHLVQFNPRGSRHQKLDVDGDSLDDEYRVLRKNLTNGNNRKR